MKMLESEPSRQWGSMYKGPVAGSLTFFFFLSLTYLKNCRV